MVCRLQPHLLEAVIVCAGALVVNVVAFYTGPHVALARDVVRTLNVYAASPARSPMRPGCNPRS